MASSAAVHPPAAGQTAGTEAAAEEGNEEMIRFELPFRVVNSSNERVHWSKKARRTAQERRGAMLLCPTGVRLPCTVTLVRIAPRAFDSDGLAISFKGIRDGIADRLGVKDNDWRVMWEYKQQKGKPKQYGVIVEITSYPQVEPHLRAIP